MLFIDDNDYIKKKFEAITGKVMSAFVKVTFDIRHSSKKGACIKKLPLTVT
ncbi:hypothetical protein SDC9_49525 [bioreactor metagenome]|uniref:Uncharacterized protein n=1 Tax=bioreactor metagenome TaxID=1076179 RepID=A0A644WHM1_9ZZZZ